MLPAKIRVALLMAVMLFALLVDGTPTFFPRADAQEPIEREALLSNRLERWTNGPGITQEKGSKPKELQKERLAAARDCVKVTKERIKNGEGMVEELIEPIRVLLEAELDVCDSNKERIAVLEKVLAEAKETERLADGWSKRGKGRQGAAHMAKAERLRIEIALERAKGGGAPQKGAPAKKADPRPVTAYVGSVVSFESVRVFAKVSGFLKDMKVDIGDRVKRGEVLAVLSAPEIEKQVQLDAAVLEQARTHVAQVKARIIGVEADLETAKLAVTQAEGNLKSAAASAKFRAAQFQRMKDLFDAKAIEERVLDESKERHVAAAESENSAKTAIAAAKSQVMAAMAKIEQAKADLIATEAGVKVAQASLQKLEQVLSFATITAPFDGIVTQRNAWAGELIRSTSNASLVTVQRIDKLRIVAMIPERDANLVNTGDPVEIEIHAVPDKKWSAKLSRMAGVLDTNTRTMRIEVDLPNPGGLIRPGMSATVNIGQSK